MLLPEALHASWGDMPFAEDWPQPGIRFQLLMADIERGVTVVLPGISG